MIYVGIDVAKDKHDCFITNSDGEVLYKPYTIPNSKDVFNELYNKICSTTHYQTNIYQLEKSGQTYIKSA
ncbi:MAG: transposase [Lachnospiraceae bacterium]|nr:transposase [Lachnospiraceae bacterium]